MKQFFTRLLIFSLIICGVGELKAQNYRLEAGVRLGGANYLGDIGGKFLPRRDFVADIKLKTTGLSAGAFARYALTPGININLSYQFGRISGADSLSTNPGRMGRNLSFTNDIMEMGAVMEFEFYENYNVGRNRQYRVDFTSFVFIGVGYFTHNPKTEIDEEINGQTFSGTIELAPLQTEGVAYELSGLALNTGIGMYWTVDRNFRIGARLGVRTTQTDYLDDVSTKYKDPKTFPETPQGQLAAAVANRSDELENSPYNPTAGSIRGNPDYDDSYVFATLDLSYVFRGKGGKFRRNFHNGYRRSGGKRTRTSRFFSF
ncbi:DUF6089 family protein [Luteibaculum oceani]|uniref:DUF6089 domain-containing protein n=1 Tax=Luteibaculum oceani TaxID=1294296 RepID=A0A5C6V8L1_9FLAO|nr:DUF6089 family protein [Luteibaculum oceani]TXC81389.1 hypothetical protein FRX97_05125 [Luteibaculum oceani]